MSPAAGTAGAPLTIREFFEAVRAGRLLVQRCTGCGELAVPPRHLCVACGGRSWEPRPLAGDGEVSSFTVIRVPPGPRAAEVPYAIVIVRMAEGVSLLGRLDEVPLEALRVGLPVRFAGALGGSPAPGDPPAIRFASRDPAPPA